MKAVIMAGGEGTRLRPQTSNLPKPMLPLVGRPMMEHIVSLLQRHGITDIVVTVAFLPNAIRNYFGDGSELGVRMVYATEETPLGTAGSVRNARDELTERFLVISGDVLTDIDLTALLEFHEKNQALATLALCAVDNPLEFGIVITREDGSIERFLEKPGWGQVFSDTINTGIYVLEPEIFDLIPEGRSVDFSSEVFPAVLDAQGPIFGYVADGYWEDVGTTAAYLKAHNDILDGKVDVDIAGFEMRPGVWLGKGSSVDPSARIDGPAFIGENCTIDAGVELGAYATLGANTRVAERAVVRHSVIGENAYLGPAARVEGAVLGRACDLRQGARCEPGSVVGEGCLIGAHAEVRGDVKVYPYKVVEAGAQVNASIVWESGGTRTLFGRDGVQGIANVDISPELAVRLAKAWASTLEKGSYITTSRDTSRAARVLKRALMVGCNAVGVNVTDLEVATIPVTRHHIRTRGTRGGLTVRLSTDDPQSVVIRFFDERGIDLSENEQRRIERLFHREEFRRVTAADIGDIDFSPRALEHYTADVVEAFQLRTVPQGDLKLVLDLSFGAASFVMPNLLSKIRADVLSVNPFAQTPGMIAVDPVASAARVAETVRGSGADLGAVIDAGGEHLTLVDGTGYVLDNNEALMVFLELVTAERTSSPPVRVALPVTVSDAAMALCQSRGVEVVQTALSSSSLMEAATSGGVVFAADQEGGYILPTFLPSFDAAASLVQLIALLGRGEETLSGLVARLPMMPMVHSEVETPFEQKGLVMRTLMEQLAEEEADVLLLDGIKVRTGEGWILLVPDPEEPAMHVWVEGVDWEATERLTEDYVRRLRAILS
ncbi:MAG TPA: sugar phosphate nucleotidyltransferase [Acidimicrobiales bacterium]|jgi:mannose-1-phosphate guanylyltransferase/phosphomannomutase|nr:sugar phosphate nucleotidyltransferase [Acidimicrobiales bacterium]